MAIRQTRIFVPNIVPYDSEDWAETLLGRVVQPLLQKYPTTAWFWFSRYFAPASMDSGDCNITAVPEEYQIQGSFRSLRFRYELPDSDIGAFEEDGNLRIRNEECVISDWRYYDLAGDLGSNRFVGGMRDDRRRLERAKLVVLYLKAVSTLVLDSLVGPDSVGQFHAERNDNSQNPLGSSYESMHHLFCNITALPLRVLVFSNGTQNIIGTDWSSPQQASWKPTQEFRIRY